jgi:hypothetical protein
VLLFEDEEFVVVPELFRLVALFVVVFFVDEFVLLPVFVLLFPVVCACVAVVRPARNNAAKNVFFINDVFN